MEEKELKTSLKQRIIIGVIAVVMLGSMIAGYALIILNSGNSSSATSTGDGVDPEKVAAYQEAYDAKLDEFNEAQKENYKTFTTYRSEVKGYNETSANNDGVATKDLLKGSGRKLEEGDTDYYAYYIGYCADETIFDSSLSDDETEFTGILDASRGLIEGWNAGVVGMRLGGVREITIPGELAYGESTEICGGYNKPLRFIVMALEKSEQLKKIAGELETASMRLQYAQYGLDYDDMQSSAEE